MAPIFTFNTSEDRLLVLNRLLIEVFLLILIIFLVMNQKRQKMFKSAPN